ncbi:separase-like, partial [Trifolium medium]|nr:separase-like [Trifolium medium]
SYPQDEVYSKCTSGKSCSVNENVEVNQIPGPSDRLSQKDSTELDVSIPLNEMKCWNCRRSQVLKSTLLKNSITLKWEFVLRKISMKLLTRLVKHNLYGEDVNSYQKYLVKSLSFLFGKDPFRHSSPFPEDDVQELPKSIGDIISPPYSFKSEDIASWLMVAFDLSSEVHIVFSAT